MAPRPKPVEYKFGTGVDQFSIFGVPANMTGNFGTLPTPDELELETVTVSVGGFSRRRYPGGPTSSVQGHERLQLDKQGDGGTNATPGREFWIETLIAPGSKKVIATKQFTTTGSMRDVLLLALPNLADNEQLRTTGGRTYPAGATID
jgi:hypothetical protein